jgi:hypothetical protein
MSRWSALAIQSLPGVSSAVNTRKPECRQASLEMLSAVEMPPLIIAGSSLRRSR